MQDLRFDATRGRRIREVRGEHTQPQFAQRFGVSLRTVQRWEEGHPPHPAQLRIIATKTRTSFAWLVSGVATTTALALTLIALNVVCYAATVALAAPPMLAAPLCIDTWLDA